MCSTLTLPLLYCHNHPRVQYKDLREGAGPPPQEGAKVVVDWDGYTIG